MKYYKLIIAILIIQCFSISCHDDLDIIQDNMLSSSNMWIEESDATSSTYGIYLLMRDALKSVHDTYLCWGELRNGLWGPGTHNTLSSVDETQVMKSAMTSNNAYAKWEVLYKTINQANLILKHVPEMKIKTASLNFALGNAYFARAWCYFWIARIWGDAPLALTGFETTGGDLYLSRSPQTEVFKQVEQDILNAEKYITSTLVDKTTATSAAVQMLKADYALWMYSVRNAGDNYLDMAEKAINNLGLSSTKLESNYADIFSSTNKLGKEVIFAIHQANGEAVNGPAYYLGWNGNYIDMAYRNKPVPITGGQQWWWYTKTYKDILTADETDKRLNLTYKKANYGAVIKSVEWTEKLMGQMEGDTRIFDSDFILYRYGEAFLFDAEIKYHKGDYAGANKSINTLVKRAYGVDNYYTANEETAVKDAIVYENLRELVGEGRTWWTLIRMDKIWDFNADVKAKRAENPNILLWPITQNAIIRNSNLTQTEYWY